MKFVRTGLLLMLAGLFGCLQAQAQQLDLSDPGLRKPQSSKATSGQPPAAAFYAGATQTGNAPSDTVSHGNPRPLTVTVTKTRYLPPAMYGQWSLIGTLISSNFDEFPTSTTDIWVLDRQGDQVVITNPANGASAVVNVTEVHDNTATIYRRLSAPSGYESDETIRMRVDGDTLTGKDVRKIRKIRNGRVVKEVFALYQFQAQRIGGSRAVFKPETSDGPDIRIEDVQAFK